MLSARKRRGGIQGLAGAMAATVLMVQSVDAEDLSAGFVVTAMPAEERYPYIAGIAEGLAYMRFIADGRTEEPGMRCVYQWFYEEDGTLETILSAFARFPDHLPGAVMGALVERRCGS